jgi:glutamate carboxypeptidase
MNPTIVRHLEEHLESYIADLRDLAAIDSGSDDKSGVDVVQDWLQRELQDLGFTVERRRQERWGDDLVARR